MWTYTQSCSKIKRDSVQLDIFRDMLWSFTMGLWANIRSYSLRFNTTFAAEQKVLLSMRILLKRFLFTCLCLDSVVGVKEYKNFHQKNQKHPENICSSSRHALKTSSTRLQGNNFSSWRPLANFTWRRLEDVLEDI